MNKINVLIVGCGDLGTEIYLRLSKRGFSVTGLRRSAPKEYAVNYIQADVADPNSLNVILPINPEFVIYCVAPSLQTDESYRIHYPEGLRHVLEALKKGTNLRHIFFISSTRVYGQFVSGVLDEKNNPSPNDFRGVRLLEAEQILHNAAGESKLWNSTSLRLTGIYGPGRIRMINLARDVNNWPSTNTWTNRIHRDDAAAFIVFLTERVLSKGFVDDCYIVTDSHPAPMLEVLAWISQKLGLPVIQEKALKGGKRMSNQRMLATGFKLQYPDYKKGYQALIANCTK